MKVELSFNDRAYVANVLRGRSMTVSENAETTKSDRQRAELTEEARYAETLALRFDNGEDLVTERPTPITPNKRIDIDSIDSAGATA